MNTEKENINDLQENNTAENNPEELKIEEMPKLPPHKAYIKRLSAFNGFYLRLIIAIGVMLVAAIAVALLFSIVLGAAIVIAAVLLYRFFSQDELNKQLGLKFTSIVGGIRITSCAPRYGDVIWIPRTLAYFEVTELCDGAIKSSSSAELRCLFLPKSLRRIDPKAFSECESLSEIRFEGSREEWEGIEKPEELSGITLFFDAVYPPMSSKKSRKKSKKK